MIDATRTLQVRIRHRRVNVTFPADLLDTLDDAVPARKRNQFIVEATARALRRDRLAQIVESLREAPAWSDDDHPELSSNDDVARHVEAVRSTWPARTWDDFDTDSQGDG